MDLSTKNTEQLVTIKKARLDGDPLPETAGQQRRQETIRGIKNGSVRFSDLPEELLDDADVALAAIRKNPSITSGTLRVWDAVSDRLKNTKEFVLTAVKVVGHFLEYASEELRADREIVLAAVRQYGGALRYALGGLCGDREIVVEAMKVTGSALQFASEELRAHRETVLTAVRQNGYALRFASGELRGNREIVLVAVQQHGDTLEHASGELRDNHEIVLKAVQNYGKALRYASQRLLNDREIVLAAVRENGEAFQFSPTELLGDREIVLAAFDNAVLVEDVEKDIVAYVPRDLQNDPMVAGAIVRNGGKLRRGSEIMERLENVLHAVRALPESDFINVVDEESAIEFSRRWEHSIWHKIWIALQLEPPGMQGAGRLFVELSGLSLELQQTKGLRHCAPVIGAALSAPRRCRNWGGDWRDLNSYPACDYDSDDGDY